MQAASAFTPLPLDLASAYSGEEATVDEVSNEDAMKKELMDLHTRRQAEAQGVDPSELTVSFAPVFSEVPVAHRPTYTPTREG